MSDDFTHQGETTNRKWVNETICLVLYYFTATQWLNFHESPHGNNKQNT